MPAGNPKWVKGVSGNPAGKPPGVFSTFSDTASRILKELSREEIIAISDDEARLNTYPAFQCLVIRQLAGALKSNSGDPDLVAERERLFDRTMGKPTNKTELSGKDGGAVEFKPVGSLVDKMPAEMIKKLTALMDAEEK